MRVTHNTERRIPRSLAILIVFSRLFLIGSAVVLVLSLFRVIPTQLPVAVICFAAGLVFWFGARIERIHYKYFGGK